MTAHLATGPIQEPEKSQAPPRNGSKTSGCGVVVSHWAALWAAPETRGSVHIFQPPPHDSDACKMWPWGVRTTLSPLRGFSCKGGRLNHKHKHANTEKHNHAKTQTQTQKHKQTKIQTRKNAPTQKKNTNTENTSTQTQKHNHTKTQKQKHKNTNTKNHKNPNAQTRKHAKTQTRKHKQSLQVFQVSA